MATREDAVRIDKLEYEEARARHNEKMENAEQEGPDEAHGILSVEIAYLKQDIRDLKELQETHEAEVGVEDAKKTADHAKEIADLKSQLQAKDVEINSLRSAPAAQAQAPEPADIPQQLTALNEQLAEAQTETNSLRVERTNCQDECQKLQNTLTETEAVLAQTLDKLAVATTEKNTLGVELETANRRICELEHANRSGAPGGTGHSHTPGDEPLSQSEMDDLAKQMEDATRNMEKYRDAIRALERQVERLTGNNPQSNEEEIAHLNQEIAAFKLQLEKCKNSKKDLNDQIDRLNSEIDQHKLDHARKHKACKDCQQEKNDLKASHASQLDGIRQNLEMPDYVGNDLYSAIIDAIHALVRIKRTPLSDSEIQDKSSEDTATINDLQEQLVIMHQRSAVGDERNKAQDKEIADLKEKITALKKKVEDCASDKDISEQRIKALIDRAGNAERDKATAEDALAHKTADVTIAELEAQLAVLRGGSEPEADDSSEQIRHLNDEINTLRRAADTANTTLQQQSDRIQQLEDELAECQDGNNDNNGQSPSNAELTRQLAAARRQLTAALTQATNLQTSLDAANSNGSPAAQSPSYAEVTRQLAVALARITELEGNAVRERARVTAAMTRIEDLVDQNRALTARNAALTSQNAARTAQLAPYTAAITHLARLSGRNVAAVNLTDEVDRLNQAIDDRDNTNMLLNQQNTNFAEAAALHREALADETQRRRAAEAALNDAGMPAPPISPGIVQPNSPRTNAEIQRLRDELADVRRRLVDAVAAQPPVSNPSVGDRSEKGVPPPKRRKIDGRAAAKKAAKLAAEAKEFVDGNMWKVDRVAGPHRH